VKRCLIEGMASAKELSDFLKGVQAKSFKRTVFSTRDEEAALDIVQDSMMKLAEKYGDRDAAELPLIYTRILQNTTLDWFRRQKTQNTWVSLFSSLRGGSKDNLDDSDYSDPLEFLDSSEENLGFEDGATILERQQVIKIIENEISKLPSRQREAFLMRYWDDLGISETARLMACSEGSVKTHCSRACAFLAKALKKQGFKL
jgi:RNA polymerase sigma-70 factor, ECF subfamily